MHEKKLNITNHLGNANQNHNRYYLIYMRMAILKDNNNNKQKITSVGEDVEKLEALCIAGGNIRWYSHYGK